jgi:hypothetical protein
MAVAMQIPVYILAHGSLGWWDDLAFLGIIVIFLGFMIWGWFHSRNDDFAGSDLMPESKSKNDNLSDDERFELN